MFISFYRILTPPPPFSNSRIRPGIYIKHTMDVLLQKRYFLSYQLHILIRVLHIDYASWLTCRKYQFYTQTFTRLQIIMIQLWWHHHCIVKTEILDKGALVVCGSSLASATTYCLSKRGETEKYQTKKNGKGTYFLVINMIFK